MTQIISDLCSDIAEIVKDYRIDEFGESFISESDVLRWINQFDTIDRLPILEEMKFTLNNYYVPKDTMINFLKFIFTDENLLGGDISANLLSTSFLDIQRKGSSQKDMLALTKEIAQEEHNVMLNINNLDQNINKYIYIDDALYSGYTLIYDIKKWLEEQNPNNNSELHIIVLATHTSGEWYATQQIESFLKQKNIKLAIWAIKKFDNNFFENSTSEYECYWPKEVIGNVHVDDYLDKINIECDEKGISRRRFFRNYDFSTHQMFSSRENRDIIEKAFLKKGSYIVSLPRYPQRTMRPMGYEYFESFGFGAVLIVYRNISNNCPLALWWGDPTAEVGHPLNGWYPLFLRKVNEG